MPRLAVANDAVEAIDVIRRSITQLCIADHKHDPTTLDRWLANKHPAMFIRWIGDSNNFCVVEEPAGKVSGVGLLRRDGEVLLFYIAPEHQRQGIGRRIQAMLEAHARELGLSKLHLDSTVGAREFYQSMGYQPAGGVREMFGVVRSYPFEKSLDLTSARYSKQGHTTP